MSIDDQKAFISRLINTFLLIFVPYLLVNVGTFVWGYSVVKYQVNEQRQQILELNRDKIGKELFLKYFDAVHEQTKLLQDKDKENSDDLKAVNLKLDDLARQIYSTHVRGGKPSTAIEEVREEVSTNQKYPNKLTQ